MFKNIFTEVVFNNKEINSLRGLPFKKDKLLYKKNGLELHLSKINNEYFLLLYRNNKLLFYILVQFNKRKKLFILMTRENLSNEKHLLGKIIYTLLKLNFRVVEDFQMNKYNIKAIKKALNTGYIKLKYDNRIIENSEDLESINDGLIKSFEYIDGRTSIVLEQWRDSSLFEEALFLEI